MRSQSAAAAAGLLVPPRRGVEGALRRQRRRSEAWDAAAQAAPAARPRPAAERLAAELGPDSQSSGSGPTAAEELCVTLLHPSRRSQALRLAEECADGAWSMGAAQVRMVLQSYATMRAAPPDRLRAAFASRGVQLLEEARPRVLSDVRRSCAWFHPPIRRPAAGPRSSPPLAESFSHPTFFEELAPRLAKSMGGLHPISAVYATWTFSKSRVGPQHPEVFTACAAHVQPRLQELDRCGLAMSVWNYSYAGATVAQGHRGLFDAVADDVSRPERLWDLSPRDLQNISWAYARGRLAHKRMFADLATCGVEWLRQSRRGSRKTPHLRNPEDVDNWDLNTLENTLAAYNQLQLAHPELFAAAAAWTGLELRSHRPLSQGAERCSVGGHTLARTVAAFAEPAAADSELAQAVEEVCDAAAPHWAALEQAGRITERDRALMRGAAGSLSGTAAAQLSARGGSPGSRPVAPSSDF